MPTLPLLITLDDQVHELQRELSMRQAVYPRQIEAKRLTHDKAERQIATLRAALTTVQHAAWRDRVARGLPAPDHWAPPA